MVTLATLVNLLPRWMHDRRKAERRVLPDTPWLTQQLEVHDRRMVVRRKADRDRQEQADEDAFDKG